MEWKEQHGWMLNPSLSQPRAQAAEHTRPVQGAPPQTTGKNQNAPPRHAVLGARPYCSPEYSPEFHKLGSTLDHGTCRTVSPFEADTSIPLQPSTKTPVPYLEKKRLLDRQEEIQEVKQLDEWKPAVGIFTAVLEGLDDNAG